jgi:hypothetical protein
MTSELQAFIDFFQDEHQLRAAIEALLSRREECTGVRQLHGRDEAGKDIIFYSPMALGRLGLNACVVKLGKITGSASDPKSGARNVLIQCEQALDTPITNTQGKEEWVGNALVMCPNELSATAMHSISGQFKGKPSQIEFICGHDFLRLFKTCWPDFIFFEPDLLSAHLENLGKELESDHNIQRLGIAHGLGTGQDSRNIYVEPTLAQVRGKLSRGVELPNQAALLRLPISEMDRVEGIIEGLIASLRVANILPSLYQSRREGISRDLRSWIKRIKDEWQKAFNAARLEAQAAHEDPPRTIPLPSSLAQAFLNSPEFKFVEDVYQKLDELIAASNGSVAQGLVRTSIPDAPAFGIYGSLVQSTSNCFPVIRFEQEEQMEWSAGELLSRNRNLLITAAAGYGKTSFSRNHFLRDLADFRSGHSKILPLYFAAHSLRVQKDQTFTDLFLRPEVSRRLELDSEVSVRVYLDGLDEINSSELRGRILKLAKEACAQQTSRVRCIATARDHVGGFDTSWLPRVSISPMTADGLRDLVTAWLDGDAVLIAAFYAELNDSSSLTAVLHVPLLATLTVLVFKNLHRLPENRLRLYQMFIDLLLGGWNLAKGLQRSSHYSSTAKQSILTRLAGLMHARREKETDKVRIKSSFTQVAPALAGELDQVLGELVEDGLLLPTGRATFMFPHLSFQEYLAAKDAIDPARFEEKRIMKNFLSGDDWFKEVAIFLVSMTTNAPRMRNWIVDLTKERPAVQGLSDADRRAAMLISKISEIFPESRPSANH